MTRRQKIMLIRILSAAALFAVLQFIPGKDASLTSPAGIVRLILYLADYLIIGYDILRKAFRGIVNGRPFDENFLMTVATIGAMGLAFYEKNSDLREAVAVMLFYQVGEFFQSVAVGRSRKNITALMDIRPDYANIERDGRLETVDPDEVETGTVIVVRPGEKVPIDGVVEEGVSSLNMSALTGESLPRGIRPGDEILSGCINLSGVLKIRTTKAFGESTVSKILEMVEDSTSHKARQEKFISRFARIYTPAVTIGAVVLAFLPPLIRLLCKMPPMWSSWIYRALVFLVISCPCALVISIPLGFFAGIGGASREGILVKGSDHLENLARAGIVVFDKTGTLTQGVFKVTGIHHSDRDEEKLLEYAACAESASSHPISRSIIKAYGRDIDESRVRDIKEISGRGVTALVDGHAVAAGNARLMESIGVTPVPCHTPGTIIHMAVDGKYAGHIVISDVVKEGSRDAVSGLKANGIRKTVMLTGDSDAVAEAVGSGLGIDEIHAELLPAGKVAAVEKLIEERQGKETLVFVGDGINDAPVLARADVGIAMGGIGSDAAVEAADVVLMDDDPRRVSQAVRTARKCLRIIYENITLALGVKAVCLALGALGIAGMWAAIFADVGVMVLAVLNAIRALRVPAL